jgi:hypothetical protein
MDIKRRIESSEITGSNDLQDSEYMSSGTWRRHEPTDVSENTSFNIRVEGEA